MRRWAVWGVLAAVLVLAGLTYLGMVKVEQTVRSLSNSMSLPFPDRTARTAEGKPMAHFHTEWTSDGDVIEVDLDQNIGETPSEFAARCRQVVDDMKLVFPKDKEAK